MARCVQHVEVLLSGGGDAEDQQENPRKELRQTYLRRREPVKPRLKMPVRIKCKRSGQDMAGNSRREAAPAMQVGYSVAAKKGFAC